MKSSRGSLTAVDGNELCQTLPDDLLERIIARVPFPFIFKARCLSKSWRARFLPISSQDDAANQCLAASFQKQVGERSSNWESYGPVIVSEEDCLAYNRSSNSWRRIPSPFFVDDNFLSQPSGNPHIEGALLYNDCLMDGHRVYVANILSRRRKLLPPCPNTDWHTHCFKLVTDASSETYKVFVLRQNTRNESYPYSVEIYDSESDSWSCKKLQLMNSSGFITPPNFAYLNGVLYLLANRFVRFSPLLWAFNVEEDTFQELQLDFNVSLNFYHFYHFQYDRLYLVVCNAELLLIAYKESQCEVLKVDLGSLKLLLLSESPVTRDLQYHQGRPVSDGSYIFLGPDEGCGRMLAYHVGEDKWSFVPVPTSKDHKCIAFSFRPGLCPFVAV